MKKGTLILICGLPGAGKTTLAKKLEIEKNAVRLCADEWIVPLLENPDDMDEADRLREPIEKLLLEHAINLAKLGSDVILENGFWTKNDRDNYKKQIKEEGIRIELHFLDVPFEILWERVNKRNKGDYPFKIESHLLEKWHNLFEPPTDEEGKTYDLFKKY